MTLFVVPLFIMARDEEHAEKIRSEIAQGGEDARDSGELEGGEFYFGDKINEVVE
jgi:hypothetical protein